MKPVKCFWPSSEWWINEPRLTQISVLWTVQTDKNVNVDGLKGMLYVAKNADPGFKFGKCAVNFYEITNFDAILLSKTII